MVTRARFIVLAVFVFALTVSGFTIAQSNETMADEIHPAYQPRPSFGGGCEAATAEEMGDCVGRMFEDPNNAYSPKHEHTSSESAPMPSARIADDPATVGVWRVVADAQVNGQKVRAIHVSLTKSGKVLVTAGSGNDPNHFAAGTFLSFVWDIAANTMTSVATPKDLFCSGHLHLPDGRLLFFGGTTSYPNATQGFLGSKIAYTFDDTANKYVALPPMEVARWYPSGPADAQGNPVIVSGADETGELTDVNERYNVTTNTWQRVGTQAFPLYPQIMLAADGRLFYSGVHVFGSLGIEPGLWQPDTNDMQEVGNLVDLDCRDQGAGLFMYPAQDQKVMVIGGGCSSGTTEATAIVDLKAVTPAYAPGPSLPFAAMHICGLNLPDGSIFASGGGDHNTRPVLRAALLRPGASAWEEVASPKVSRMYHSTCILSPDGAVLTFGTDVGDETRIERYEPWYMAKPRPAITGDIAPFALGGTYDVSYTSANGAREAMLVRPSSVTHSSDPNQRAVKVPVTPAAAGQLSLKIDDNPALLPPGHYMLFLVDESGVPSEARWVHVSH